MVKSPHLFTPSFTLTSAPCAHMSLHETCLFIVAILRLLQSQLVGARPGLQPTLETASAGTESRTAPWEEAPEGWGIAGSASWARPRGSSGQERWLWPCLVFACVLSGPHSSISSYEEQNPSVAQQPQQEAPRAPEPGRAGVAHITHVCFRSIRGYFEVL